MNLILAYLTVTATIVIPVGSIYGIFLIGVKPKERKQPMEEVYPDEHLFI
jgi:hypothetical protein